jgi:hypothetical protein
MESVIATYTAAINAITIHADNPIRLILLITFQPIVMTILFTWHDYYFKYILYQYHSKRGQRKL